jgi:hypothetical protein
MPDLFDGKLYPVLAPSRNDAPPFLEDLLSLASRASMAHARPHPPLAAVQLGDQRLILG